MSFLDKIKEKLPNRSHDDEDLEDEFDDEIGDDDEDDVDDEASDSPIARIINQIKQKFSKNDDDDDDDEEDEDEEEEEDDSSDDNTTQINVNRELLESDDEYDEEEDEDEDDLSPLEQIKQKLSSILPSSHAKNGKKSKISPISALVILGLVYLGLDMFSEKKAPPVQAKHKKARKQHNRVPRVKRERKKVVAVPTPSPTPRIEKKIPEVSKVTDAVSERKEQNTAKPKEDSSTSQVETEGTKSSEQNKINTGSDLDVDDMLSEITDDVPKTSGVKKSSVEGEKSVSEIPYVEQPRYDLLGRGLVYNCQKGYWACVDKSSFFQCKDNFSWAKKSGKPLECVPREVYATIKDCRVVQVYNINTAVKATFCNPK